MGDQSRPHRSTPETGAHSAGLGVYAFLIDTEDPNRLVIIEVWESPDAFDRHMKHSHTIDLMAAIPDLAADDYSMTVRDTER
jgi:quinol monooxygenase YgiN